MLHFVVFISLGKQSRVVGKTITMVKSPPLYPWRRTVGPERDLQ